MKITSSALTDVGKIRELNEDYFVIKEETSPSTSKFGKLGVTSNYNFCIYTLI